MTRKDRVRLIVGLVLTLAIVLPLGWMWWNSRLPASYSAMDMGEMEYGGGPGSASSGEHHDMESMAHGTSTSVVDLDTTTKRKADVVVNLTARQGKVRIASGKTVEGYSLNDRSPGPLIEATVGQLVEVRLRNESVKGGVALHWHGVDVPNAEDGVAGVTQDAVQVGDEYTYRWIAPAAGSYWYHSHQLSNEQVTGGLFGGIIVHPKQRESAVEDVFALSHLYADVPTIDGQTGSRHVMARAGQRVRVRLVNTDNGQLDAWSGAPFLVRAIDGTDVRRPTEVSDRSIAIPAGGRADLELRVPTDGSAVRVAMTGDVSLTIGPAGSKAAPVKQPKGDIDLLDYGSSADLGFDASRPDRKFEYSVGRRPGFLNGKPGVWWSVNGKLYKDMPMFMVREGDVVQVRISNHSGQSHPMHLHGHHAVVLSRNGVRASGSPWWFDSLEVENGDSYDIAFVADNPGVWMDHCHNLKHATEGLVTHLMYEGVTTPYKLGSDSGNTPE